MEKAERALLDAIRNALFGTKTAFAPDTDWDAVQREAEAQAVLGVAVWGVPSDVRLRWKQAAGQVTATYLRNLTAQDRLLALLDANGIPTAILKGTSAACYYPIPSARRMGDIDFIVPQAACEQTKALLAKNGYHPLAHHDNPRHVGFARDGATFELHHHFSYPEMDLEAYVIEGLQHPEQRSVDGHRFPMLPRLANGLVLLAHMLRHLKAGLGLRQVLDWMLYAHAELDDAFWEQEFSAAAESVGLKPFAVTATRMCELFLGLPKTRTWTDAADERLCEDLLNCLLSSGNFGRKNGEGGKIETVVAAFRREGFFRYLQRAGEANWAAYHRHAWLRPFAWLYQSFRYLRQGVRTHRTRRQILADADRGAKRTQLVNALQQPDRKEQSTE